jgi:hypothetical protein
MFVSDAVETRRTSTSIVLAIDFHSSTICVHCHIHLATTCKTIYSLALDILAFEPYITSCQFLSNFPKYVLWRCLSSVVDANES